MTKVIKNEKEDNNLPSLSDLDQSGAWKVDNENFEKLEMKRIMTFETGKLFRGHGGGIHKVGNSLSLVNCYWTDIVVQNYCTKTNVTNTEYSVDSGSHPKYIRKIMDNLNHDYYKFELDDVTVNVYDWSIKVTRKVKYDGLEFKDHWDNINELKQLRFFIRRIKDVIKNHHNIFDKIGKLNSDRNCVIINDLNI